MPTSQPAPVLAGQRALVTGANSGIGAEVAKALAGAGAKVVVNYVTAKEQADQVVAEITAGGGEAMAIFADVSKEDQVQAMFAEMLARYGSIDIVVNNAGLQRDAAFHEMTLQQWQLVLDVNLTGQFLCARAAIREFLRRGPLPDLSCALGKIVCLRRCTRSSPGPGTRTTRPPRAASACSCARSRKSTARTTSG